MPIKARIECDSISPSGKRLTTFVCTYPRIILAEINTHRMLSRNTASSRAIPIEKMIKAIEENPFIPTYWPKNQKGMQALDAIVDENQFKAITTWNRAKLKAIEEARRLIELGVHKQIVNRLLEPFSWVTSVISATEWDNFFGLRCHWMAQPEFQELAFQMAELYFNNEPEKVDYGFWHLPFIDQQKDRELLIEDLMIDGNKINDYLCKISAARCGRVSYLTHEGKRDISKDLELYDRLVANEPRHSSPLEHIATSVYCNEHGEHKSGNFIGWKQLRKTIKGENFYPFTKEILEERKKERDAKIRRETI